MESAKERPIRDTTQGPGPTRPGPRSAGPAFVAGLAAVLLGFNAVAHLTPGYTNLYVPLNLAMAALVVVAARRIGMDTADVGLEPVRAPAGLRWGAAVGVVAAAVLAVAVAVPSLHGLLDDERIAGIGPGLLAYRALVRIPLGTVLLEEVAFRGVLFGAWTRWRGVVAATVGSSVLFGLWHIRPSIELLDMNDVADGTGLRVAAVAASVAVTALAGALFCWLRIRSRSLLAPITAHFLINSLALLAAYIVR